MADEREFHYDAILIPNAVRLGFGRDHGVQARAIRNRYGHLLGHPPGPRPDGRDIYMHELESLQSFLVTFDPGESYLFPVVYPKIDPETGQPHPLAGQSHPLAKTPRYDWFPLEDGTHGGVRKPEPPRPVHSPVGVLSNEVEERAKLAMMARDQARGVRAEDNISARQAEAGRPTKAT